MTNPEPVDYLNLDDVLEIAASVIEDPVVRDIGLLASAVARPRTSAFGADAYPTFVAKAASLLQSLARNHALVDGNKRLSWAATRVFCLLNGHDLVYTVDGAEELVVAVASGELEIQGIEQNLAAHLR